jgi:hypothetical protein
VGAEQHLGSVGGSEAGETQEELGRAESGNTRGEGDDGGLRGLCLLNVPFTGETLAGLRVEEFGVRERRVDPAAAQQARGTRGDPGDPLFDLGLPAADGLDGA